jgi:polysaccharide biosynthesis/export protein
MEFRRLGAEPTDVDIQVEVFEMILRLSLLAISFTVAASVCTAQTVSSAANSTVSEPSGYTSAHPLRLSAGDLLEVTVLGTIDPDLQKMQLRVNGQGMIVPNYGDPVKVEGRTAEDAVLLIEENYREKKVVNDPRVSVTVKEYATQGVTVAGEVKSPGVYPLLGTHNLLDLISAAGGVTPNAGKGVTITHRQDPDHPTIVNVATKPGSTSSFNVDIEPGDIIMVSHAGIVYVLGDVGKPGGFLIENSDRLSVLQAVALAQGTNRTASLSNAKLIRKTTTGHEERVISLKKILADKGEDQILADGDILYIPTSGAKNALRDVEAILPSAASAAIYHAP